MMRTLLPCAAIVTLLFATACATSPLGRKQLMLVDDNSMNQMGAQAFEQVKKQTPINADPAVNRYVRCVALPLTLQGSGPVEGKEWEVRVFESPEVNAFALPGGKIGVYTGLLKVAKTPGQLAAVLGHETGHVIARHGAERVSVQELEGGAMSAVSVFVSGGTQSATTQQLLMSAIGLGTQLGVTLPYSRTQESEADQIGQDLMAQAGFDPKESIDLWRNMAAQGGSKPPELLSDHPADEKRIEALQKNLPNAEGLYAQAQAKGLKPVCTPPR